MTTQPTTPLHLAPPPQTTPATLDELYDEWFVIRCAMDTEMARHAETVAALTRRGRRLRTLSGKQRHRSVAELRRDASLEIVSCVARHYGVSLAAIVGDARRAAIVDARHVACYLLHQAGRSYPEAGRILNRDHTTVMHGARRVRKLHELMSEARKVQRLIDSGRE